MSAVMVMLSPGEAQRLTQRIKLTASSIRDNLFKLRNLVDEAKSSNVWAVLGYQSWTAYLADTLADEPMRLGRDERQELVGYLAGEGLSTRAIAPIVGSSFKTVARDLEGVSSDTPQPTNEPSVVTEEAEPFRVFADPQTGEVIEPTVTEHTVTERVKTVTGLDGKTYTRPKPKPIIQGDAAELDNAVKASQSIGKALITLDRMQYPEHRERVIARWWPMGNEEVPPMRRALFEPTAIRKIAGWLLELADELENSK